MKRQRKQAKGHKRDIEKRLAVAVAKCRAVAVNGDAFAAWLRAS